VVPYCVQCITKSASNRNLYPSGFNFPALCMKKKRITVGSLLILLPKAGSCLCEPFYMISLLDIQKRSLDEKYVHVKAQPHVAT
jgi:hypothetical protein